MTVYIAAGFGLGLLVIVFHVIRSRERRQQARLERAVELLLASQGVTAGVRLMAICITAKNLAPFSNEDRVYVFIGGLALIWASAVSLWKELERPRAHSGEPVSGTTSSSKA